MEEPRSLRVCRKCGNEKDLLDNFHKCPKNEQRRKTICKACAKQYTDNRIAKLEFERNQFF
jgi:hypothetical protein